MFAGRGLPRLAGCARHLRAPSGVGRSRCALRRSFDPFRSFQADDLALIRRRGATAIAVENARAHERLAVRRARGNYVASSRYVLKHMLETRRRPARGANQPSRCLWEPRLPPFRPANPEKVVHRQHYSRRDRHHLLAGGTPSNTWDSLMRSSALRPRQRRMRPRAILRSHAAPRPQLNH